MLRGIVKALAGLLSRGDVPADPAAVKQVEDAMDVRVCWACRGDPKPLLVLLHEATSDRAPHAFLMRCADCGRVQLDFREGDKRAAYCFDAADSARLVDIVRACPDPLAQDCACEVHAALRKLPALASVTDRYPDPCLYDLPRLTLGSGDPPAIALRSGAIATRYAPGTPKAQGELADGGEHGAWTLWHENGKQKSMGSYAHGLRIGEWTHWLPSGRLQAKETFHDGKRTGFESDPRAEIEEALQVSACLACASDSIEVAMLLERRGIAPHLEGHVIAYDHRVLVRCAACGGGQLDKRAKDSGDWESVYEQGTAFCIDKAGIARFSEAAKACPEPLSENCRCAVHASLKGSLGVLPPDPDGEFRHVPRLTIEASRKGPRLVAMSGRFVTQYASGKPRSDVGLERGALEGRCTRWHVSGQKASEGEMRGGARQGRWMEWNQQGEVLYDREWKDGYTV